jgi:ParB-like chromosome segregation protein Spo0J
MSKAEPEKHTVALDSLEVVYVDVDSLNPNSYNPNRQTDKDFALLRSSIHDDGFTQPVIVIRHNREIVDGEHRWRAALAEGMKQIPVVFVDMTPEQQRISTLRHNRARGSEDVNLAAELLRDLAGRGAADFALDKLGMAGEEMEMLLKDVKAPEVYDAPEVLEAKEKDPEDFAAIADATRAAERRLDGEKTAQDAVAKARDQDTFRLDLSFTSEEWTFVRAVLGDHPADRLLALCKAKLEMEVPA